MVLFKNLINWIRYNWYYITTY